MFSSQLKKLFFLILSKHLNRITIKFFNGEKMEKVKRDIEEFTLYLSKEQKRKLKIYSFLTSRTMNDIIKEAIDEYLKNHPLKDEDFQKLKFE